MTEESKQRYLAAKRKLFRAYYAGSLNPEQTDAVLSTKGPLLILAGAGSGKTTVLVRRICHIIKYGTAYETEFIPPSITEGDIDDMELAANLPPEDIEPLLSLFIHHPCPPWAMLAITFTNKAAREIKERLSAALGDGEIADDIWAGTFHSICVRILRRYGDRVGLPSSFSIYDTQDKKRLISDVMKELDIDEKILPVRAVMSAISAEKDNLRLPEEMPEGRDLRQRHLKKIYEAYQKRLEKNGAVDFDDIIMKTVKLLERDEEVLAYYQGKFSYTCVDEYQDTNPAQFRLCYLLSGGNRNIMVVGDDDQSIYKFRGATIENILQFDKVFPDARVVKLEQNYRSTKTILAAANAVIAHNADRHDKALWCAGTEGEKITVHTAENGDRECRYIIDTILKGVVTEHRKYGDYAILYRINEISRHLETVLAKSGLPYRLLGGMRFYDRKEIKDIMSYLYLIQNAADNGRLVRIINEPKRGIGAKTVETVAAVADEEGLSMFAVMKNAASYPALAKSAEKLRGFTDLIESLSDTPLAPSALLPVVMERTGYMDMLRAGGDAMKSDIDNLNELISAAVEYEKKTEEPTLFGFLEEAALVSDVDKYDEDADAVVLMTIHSAKGLEFPIVFLAGAEEGVFPGPTVRTNPEELSEERRLAYVAITRAKERLYVTHATERLLYGTTQHNRPSRFIAEEIPEHLKKSDRPVAPPPRTAPPAYRPRESAPLSKEFGRASTLTQPRPAASARAVAAFTVGDRVRHMIFGTGEITAVRPMGGDTLYEIRFDNGQIKKLMATYAKLTRA
ncbi:MAG: UvrD-helicase domain-containing protein [Clostridia bacterium]|nr:UvrD-helicase domain-containing protein [Clostridia bacterium]